VAKSRAPFRMPRNSQDDSVPTVRQGQDGELAWSQLGLLTELVDSVYKEMKLEAPTPVQQMTIPALLKEPPEHLAFLAATGSGKTLAYLLPLLQLCKSQELFDSSLQRRPKRPRVLILAPTRELALQITAVTKQLCHRIKLSSQCVVGGEDYGKQRKLLERYVDVVVATPGRLLKHWKNQNVFLGDVQHVVLDEMDTMLEQGFQNDLGSLLHPLLYSDPTKPDPTSLKDKAPRIILTSATMTQQVQKLVGQSPGTSGAPVSAKKHYTKPSTSADEQDQQSGTTPSGSSKIVLPPVKVLTSPGLHKAVPRLKQVFVDVGNIDKMSLLVDVVAGGGGRGAAARQEDLQDSPLTLVFCNTVSSCRAAQHALAEAGQESLCYHGELNSLARSENLERFRRAGQGDEKEATILVCTDLAARGLDVPEVDHVVMFDFPLNALDYLHRSGRTARGVSGDRAGNGRVTALVAKRDRVLASAISNAVQKGQPLDGLSSRKTDYLPGARLNQRGPSPPSRSSSRRGTGEGRGRTIGSGRGGTGARSSRGASGRRQRGRR
jgi:superfamily II DNA/RNA helicase